MGSSGTTELPRYPVFFREKKKDNSILVIMMIVIVIIAIVTAVIIYLTQKPDSTNTVGRCEPGLCVVNLGTGIKTCPDSTTEQLEHDIVFEVCSSESYCQDAKAPCAILQGGTLNCDGVCGPGNPTCRCAPRP